MPWQLTTPVDAGDLDPNGPYAQVKIMKFTHDARIQRIHITLEYGNTVDSEWAPGRQPYDKLNSVVISGDDYISFVSTHMSNDDELTYNATKRGLYEWLLANGHIAPGSIV